MALEAIRKLLQSSTCDWISNKQCITVIHIIQGKKGLLVALLTSSEKSMVLILAATLGSRKIFLVVILLISLLEDWK